jgi:hypothetical protein
MTACEEASPQARKKQAVTLHIFWRSVHRLLYVVPANLYNIVGSIERLYEGHLHPLLEHPIVTAGHSSKELFEQLINNNYSAYINMSPSHGSPHEVHVLHEQLNKHERTCA